MSDGPVISILSDDEITPPLTLEYIVAQPYSSPLLKNSHEKSLSAFFTQKKGCKRLFHKPNSVQTRSGNVNGGEDNGKGGGRKKNNYLFIYSIKVGHKGGGQANGGRLQKEG